MSWKSIAAGILPAFVVCPLLFTSPLRAGDETLTLRINDAVGRPGRLVAVVIRTYAPRGVGNGQICLVTASKAPEGEGSPFVWMHPRPLVFADAQDAEVEASFDEATQEILVAFSSPSGSINESDGPLAVIFLRLAEEVAPGVEYTLALDFEQTLLWDENGQPIPIEPREGELEVLPRGARYPVSADGDDVAPGELGELSVQTYEPRPLSSGQVAFWYDPAFFSETPTVTMDPRYGAAVFSVDDTQPGLLLITFESPGSSLNRVPGDIIEISAPVPPDLPPGSRSEVRLDPEETFLVDDRGRTLRLALEGDTLVVE